MDFEDKFHAQEIEQKMEEMIGEKVDKVNFWTKKFVLECVSQCVFPYPGRDPMIFMPCLANSGHKVVAYFFSDFVLVFMFVRFYGFIRHLERYHEFTDINSKKICSERFNFRSGRMFTIKCELYYRQASTIIKLFVFSVAILAFILRVFEIPYDIKSDVQSVTMSDYGTAIWLTVITFTTVGYGDFYPHTLFGQITCIIIAIWGTFVTSLLIMVVTNLFAFSQDEQKAVFFIKQSRSASAAIFKALKFFQAKRKYYEQRLK